VQPFFAGIWIDMGLGLITGGFIPTPLHKVVDCTPILIELTISLGTYSVGAMILTILFKIAVGVKTEDRLLPIFMQPLFLP
jgi:molybdopterin-containing oxidoreductase family membrane subunit